MKSDAYRWLAPAAAGLLLMAVGRAASGAEPEPTPADVAKESRGKDPVTKPKKEVDSGALARQRLRRCQLHPGTCVESAGAAAKSGATHEDEEPSH